MSILYLCVQLTGSAASGVGEGIDNDNVKAVADVVKKESEIVNKALKEERKKSDNGDNDE